VQVLHLGDCGGGPSLPARWARRRGATLPIETTTIDRAARELDLAVAVAEVYRTDPACAAPEAVWDRLARSMPTLLVRPVTSAGVIGGGGLSSAGAPASRWARVHPSGGC
jgi:hypothetical protein